MYDMSGMKFGKLTVLEFFGSTKTSKNNLWRCKCECGNETISHQSHLKGGKSKSCGCGRIEAITKHNMHKNQFYSIWSGINTRCNNKNDPGYKNYGARGIKLCEEWQQIEGFIKWAEANGYKKGLQIDRINNDGDYEPSNCHFVTGKENSAVGKRRMSSRNTSGYVGVILAKKYGTWFATIKQEGKQIYIGSSKTIEGAVKLRIEKEIELFGEQKTNFNYIDSEVNELGA